MVGKRGAFLSFSGERLIHAAQNQAGEVTLLFLIFGKEGELNQTQLYVIECEGLLCECDIKHTLEALRFL